MSGRSAPVSGASFRCAHIALAAALFATPASAQTARPYRVVALGTSLTASGGWTEPLRVALERCLARSVEMVVIARPGATSAFGRAEAARAAALAPDAVLIEFAINDAGLHKPVTLGRSRDNMAAILRAFADLRPAPLRIVMAMNPTRGWRGLARPRRHVYDDAHKDVADAVGARFVDHGPRWERLYGAQLAHVLPDGLHPLPEAARAVMVDPLAALLGGAGCGG